METDILVSVQLLQNNLYYGGFHRSKDWLSETTVINVYDSFFRNYISMVLLSFIVLSSQSQRLLI